MELSHSGRVTKPTKVGSFYPILANQLWIYEHLSNFSTENKPVLRMIYHLQCPKDGTYLWDLFVDGNQ